MKRLAMTVAVFCASCGMQAWAQTVATPVAKPTSSFEKSAFSKTGNSFARERGLEKPASASSSNDINAFYGQQVSGAGYPPYAAPRYPGAESSDR